MRAAEAARGESGARTAVMTDRHACGFLNPPRSRFCAGCGVRLG